MGVVNLTPDSFSDGGAFPDPQSAVRHAEQLLADGADLLDLGAESTRPGAEPVALEEEWARLAPVLEALARGNPRPVLSVDTTKPELFLRAWNAGATIINDINGFRSTSALQAAAQTDAALVVMHMQGTPQTMQQDPSYGAVVSEISDFFRERIEQAQAHGVEKSRLALDPGIGFGKTLAHNLEILQGLEDFSALACPLVVGLSRKSWIAQLDPHPAAQSPKARLAGSLTGALAAACRGASILRVHDVRETVQALQVARGLGWLQ